MPMLLDPISAGACIQICQDLPSLQSDDFCMQFIMHETLVGSGSYLQIKAGQDCFLLSLAIANLSFYSTRLECQFIGNIPTSQ